MVATSSLSIGSHTITISGLSSNGQALTDLINISVEPFLFDIVITPDEVRPTGTTNSTAALVNITVTSAGRPISGQNFIATVTSVLHSGCHNHNGAKPVGVFSNTVNTTDINGAFATNYTPSSFGGSETIRIISALLPTASDSRNITTRVPSLVLLPASGDYDQVGGTANHPGPPMPNESNTNHWGTQALIDSIIDLATAYNNRFANGPNLGFNDMSLPFGGLFDINGNWATPHRTHREGHNVDLRINNLIQ